MSRKNHQNSDDIPYSFISLTSQQKHPSLEIDLKRITQHTAPSKKIKKHKSASSSHSHLSSSARSESNYNESDTSSILRPISIDAITPPISKNWKNSSNSNTWEETPIKHVKANPSPMENLTLPNKNTTKYSFNKAQTIETKYDSKNIDRKEESIIEEEEEERESSEDAIDIDISEETDEKSLNFLNTLINKIKNKGQSTSSKSKSSKNSQIDSLNLQPPLSPLTATNEETHTSSSRKKAKSKASSHHSSQLNLQEEEEFENQSNKKTITLKNKCYQLDKYLEENGYNDIESESDHKLKVENDNKNNYFPKRDSKRRNYTVEKENYQICDVRECDYEFESPYPLNMQHFLIFNVDNQPQSNNRSMINDKSKINDKSNQYSNPPSSHSKVSIPTQSRNVNENNDLIEKDKNNDSCSIPFSNSSSSSQYSSPSKYGRSPNSPRLSPRLQKMKENSSSRGTSPDAKMLRDKAIGNAYLSTKDMSIWCQLEEYNEEEENDDFDIEFDPNREARSKRQTAPLNTRIIRSRNEPENDVFRSKTFNRNAGRFTANADTENNERRGRNNNDRRYRPETRERNVNSFSPSRSNQNSTKNFTKKGGLFPNKTDLNDNENEENYQMTDKKHTKIIYAEHFVQTEDISNEEELM